MLVNLVGNIGAGKTRFANWFVSHYNWLYASIDHYRYWAADKFIKLSPVMIEEKAWEAAYEWNIKNNIYNRIFEHSGTTYRALGIFTKDIIKMGIYTIKIVAPYKICKRNAMTRVKQQPIFPYVLDDTEMLRANRRIINDLEANLIVTLIKPSEELYKKIADKIYEAKTIFEAKTICDITI